MNRFLLLLLAIPSFTMAQYTDSIRTQVLNEVVVVGIDGSDDTLQNFYKGNSAATTEAILSRMKGISLIRRGAFGQEPVIRGMSNGQLNVTIGGMRMFGACTDRMDPVTIYVEPANLSVAQAMAGPRGSAYGSTVGGSLNMDLAQARAGTEKVSGTIGMGFQSSALAYNLSSVVNVSKKTSGYRTSLVYRKSGNYHAGGGDEVPFSQYEKINFSVAGKWALASYDTLIADAILDRGSNIGFPALTMDVGRADAGIFSVTYRRVAPWWIFHKLTGKTYYNTISHTMDDTKRPDVDMHMDMPGWSKTAGFFVDTDVHIFHEHQTLVKLDYFANELLGEMTMYPGEGEPMYMQTAPASVRQDAGIYFAQHYRINAANKLLLTFRGDFVHDRLKAGIGADQLEVFYPGIQHSTSRFLKTMAVNYRHNVSSSLIAEANVGYGERMPTLNERFGFYLYNRFDGYDYLGNPDLLSESSLNTEVSLEYFSSAFEVQATGFYQSFNNYILGTVVDGLSTMTVGARGVKTYQNVSGATLTGLDLMVLARPFDAMQWITNIKYAYGTIRGHGAVPLIPPFKSVSSLRWQYRTLDIQGEWEYAMEQHHVSEEAGEQRTPSYNLFNVRTGFKAGRHWKLSAGVENVFDTRYREHLDWGNIMRPGRNFYTTVHYTF